MNLRSLLLLPLLFTAGCAVATKSDPIWPVYYSPLPAMPAAETKPAPPADLRVRLRDVSGAAHLKEDMVFRRSPVTYYLYDGHLWTERPEEYVRHALARGLFEERGVGRSHASGAPTILAEVLAFEETREPSGVLIEVTVQVHERDAVLLQKTFRVTRDVTADPDEEGDRQAAVAEAMGLALRGLTDQVVDAVLGALEEPR